MRVQVCSFIVLPGLILTTTSLNAQLNISSVNSEFIIDFDATVSGVNNGSFDGSGFASAPAVGQLDSDGFIYSGCNSPASVAFGGTATTGDAARGNSDGGVSSGGIYSFEARGGNNSMGAQLAGSDFTPGDFTLRVQNTMGSNMLGIRISYEVFYLNNAPRSNSFDFAHSSDDISYTSVPSHNVTTSTTADSPAYWQKETKVIDVSGISVANSGFYYFQWQFDDNSGSSSRDEFAIDNIKILANTSCATASEPTTDATSASAVNIGCNGMTLNWTSGNGTNRIVVARVGSAISGNPADQSYYPSEPDFGAGPTIASDEFVVYNGSDTTVTILGLNASTTYHYAIYEYNGQGCQTNYKTDAELTFSATTTACNTCPYVESIVANACNGTGAGNCNSEGRNEIAYFNTGDYSVLTNYPGLDFIYNNTSDVHLINDGVVANSTSITNLNTQAGCSIFRDISNREVIPPGSHIMFVQSTFCTTADMEYDFSGLCSAGEIIYVAFTDDGSLSASGTYSHSSSGERDVSWDARFFASGCQTTCTYAIDSLTAGDGAHVICPNSTGDATGYVDAGCSFNSSVLPVTLLSFDGKYSRGTVQLSWATGVEVNNDYFEVEKSVDGFEFAVLGTIDGAGNSSRTNFYRFLDRDFDETAYYRLKQTDFDGGYQYSRTIVVSGLNDAATELLVYPNPVSSGKELFLILGTKEVEAVEVLGVDGIAAKFVFDAIQSKIVFEKDLPKGVFIVNVILQSGQMLTRQIVRR